MKQNQKIENYAALKKIITYWKTSNEAEGVPLPSKDRRKVAQLDEIYRKINYRQLFDNVL